MIYNETSDAVFTIVAIDGGTPARGATETVRLTLSNTCLMNVMFETIEMVVQVDQVTGAVTMRLPQYWVYDFGKFILRICLEQ